MFEYIEGMSRDELELLLANCADVVGQIETQLLAVDDVQQAADLVIRLGQAERAQRGARLMLVLWASHVFE